MGGTSTDCDVLVIGGGPAGSTIATLLRERGRSVVLLEKDRHPRFHIGESLLPPNMPILERLGVLDAVARIGVVKPGADLNLPHGGPPQAFGFAEADAAAPTAFQVKRAEFDHLLLENARARDVSVLEGVAATAVDFDDIDQVRVTATDDSGAMTEWSCAFLVDASGRDTFLAGRLGLKQRDPRHNSAAIFAHFDGVPRRAGVAAGNISIYWFDHGWIWMIPLYDGRMSVGVVCWPNYLKSRRGDLDAFLAATIARCPAAARRMADADAVTPATATGNFSYACQTMFGDRFLLVGDAYAFIDPIFSTGVFIAMYGAERAAEAVDACLERPNRSPKVLAAYDREMRRGLKALSWFIYRFTTPATRALFMSRVNPFGMRKHIIRLLAGDAFRHRRAPFPVLLYKGVYYAACLALWQSMRAHRRAGGVGER